MFKRTAIVLISIVAIAATASAKSRKHDNDDDDSKRHGDCKESLSDRGSQRPSESGAKGTAEKAWTQSVRFKYGELYADLANARDVKYECTKSSIGGVLKRCEITARPCRAGAEKAKEDHK